MLQKTLLQSNHPNTKITRACRQPSNVGRRKEFVRPICCRKCGKANCWICSFFNCTHYYNFKGRLKLQSLTLTGSKFMDYNTKNCIFLIASEDEYYIDVMYVVDGISTMTEEFMQNWFKISAIHHLLCFQNQEHNSVANVTAKQAIHI